MRRSRETLACHFSRLHKLESRVRYRKRGVVERTQQAQRGLDARQLIAEEKSAGGELAAIEILVFGRGGGGLSASGGGLVGVTTPAAAGPGAAATMFTR